MTSDTSGLIKAFLTVFSASLARPTAWYASNRNFTDAADFSFVPGMPPFLLSSLAPNNAAANAPLSSFSSVSSQLFTRSLSALICCESLP